MLIPQTTRKVIFEKYSERTATLSKVFNIIEECEFEIINSEVVWFYNKNPIFKYNSTMGRGYVDYEQFFRFLDAPELIGILDDRRMFDDL